MSPARSSLEEVLWYQMQTVPLALPEREYAPVPGRRWRCDFAWPGRRLALEVEGGQWRRGSHLRPRRYEHDCEKYNTLAVMGWMVIRVTTDMVNDGRALAWIERALARPGMEKEVEKEDTHERV